MIITIVGGGSTFTPGIVKSIALRQKELEVEEDGVLVRENKEYEVKKGDIVLLMYRIVGEKKEDPIIINNDDLSNYYERKKEYIEKERNRNSGEKICDSCEPVCECSNNY